MINTRASTLCLYGATGSFKTSNIGRCARYVYEKTGKPTRLISADGGGWSPIEPEIEAGIIEAFRLTEHRDLLGIIRKLSRGYWPQAMAGTSSNGGTASLTESSTNGLAGIGAYAIEGLTSISMLLLRHLANKGQKINEEVVGMFDEGGEKFAAPARSHYGFVQNMILDLITDFSSLPVDRVLFTAHEGKGQDEFSRQLVYGPAAVGQAATNRIPPYVGDLIHFDAVETTVGAGTAARHNVEVRAYLRPHADPQTRVLWPAKVRLRPNDIPALNAKWPDGYIPLTLESGIDDYLKFQDSMSEERRADAQKFKEAVDATKT